jgi:Uma2 family endonuclease
LYEVVNGEKREIPHMGALAGTIASYLLLVLGAFARQHKLGVAVMEVLFQLKDNRHQRRPDLAFVSSKRWKPLVGVKEDPPAYDVVPNLAVEVVSPSNTAQEILDKLGEYFDAGVELVWVIYPLHRVVYVYTSPTQNAILKETDALDGGQVLPGFRLSLAELFGALDMPQ